MLVLGRKKKLLIGLVAGVPLLAFGSVELTSTPAFCRSCHEIEPVYLGWSRSPHAPVKGKERADCRDCHLPSWTNPLAVVWAKLTHGFKDAYHHYASEETRRAKDFYFRLKQSASREVSSDTCLGCHEEVLDPSKDVIESEDGTVRGLHTAKEIRKLACTMCHKNTGHGPYL